VNTLKFIHVNQVIGKFSIFNIKLIAPFIIKLLQLRIHKTATGVEFVNK